MPKLIRKTAIISRQYELSGVASVRALVWKPTSDGEGYYCYFQIKGIGDEKFRFAYGGDSVQALELALRLLATFLYMSEEYKAGQLTWCGERDLGLPEVSGYRFGEPTAD